MTNLHDHNAVLNRLEQYELEVREAHHWLDSQNVPRVDKLKSLSLVDRIKKLYKYTVR